jgi:cob(I)alamin adenosyltransferase
VYTGNGKGKTTAALGLILRACGAGLRVYLGQFMKRGRTSEIRALSKRFPEVTVRQYGHGSWVRGRPDVKAVAAAHRGWIAMKKAVHSGRYDVVVADEINPAVHLGILPVTGLLQLIADKPDSVELVLTGRNAHPQVIRKADLVTEMREIKHYFQTGVSARRGIEQ